MLADLTTPERILAAAVAIAEDPSRRSLSVEAVARQSGLSRQTIYKHYRSRAELVAAVVSFEARAFNEGVKEATAGASKPLEALEALFATGLAQMRSHRILDSRLAANPEIMLPIFADPDGLAAEALFVPALDESLEALAPEAGGSERAATRDVLVRLMLSYAVQRPTEEVEALARRLARASAGMLAVPADPAPESSLRA